MASTETRNGLPYFRIMIVFLRDVRGSYALPFYFLPSRLATICREQSRA
jgi:hypothetical protein